MQTAKISSPISVRASNPTGAKVQVAFVGEQELQPRRFRGKHVADLAEVAVPAFRSVSQFPPPVSSRLCAQKHGTPPNPIPPF